MKNSRVSAVAGARVARVAPEEREVALVRLGEEVEDVAHERQGAEEHVDTRVDDHPRQHDPRQLEFGSLADDPEAGHRSRDVADDRYEADDRVQAEPAAAGSGDLDQVVEEPRHVGDPPLSRREPGRARRIDAGDGSGRGGFDRARVGVARAGGHAQRSASKVSQASTRPPS